VVLLDTTVLSNFAHIKRMDLLRLALPDAMTTPHVVTELKRGIASGHVPTCDCGWLEVVELTPSEEISLAHVRLVLDDGEASCIAVALEREASLFTDDLDARRYGQRHGICVSGTLGVLSLLVKGSHLTVAEADDCLQRMITHGYRSPVRSLADLGVTAGGGLKHS
jgi:predicted nucleic acid-binding protein